MSRSPLTHVMSNRVNSSRHKFSFEKKLTHTLVLKMFKFEYQKFTYKSPLVVFQTKTV